MQGQQMKENYFRGSTAKLIDYRNATFQGITDSNGRRHGFGIVLDDEMNLYCSEWNTGTIDGMTFIRLANGNCLYGQWKHGQPHGLNVFKNRLFTVYSHFLRGKPCQEAIVIDEGVSQIMVVNGQSLTNSQDNEFEMVSSEKIVSQDLFEEVLLYTAQKLEMMLEKYEISPGTYLSRLANRYSALARLTSIDKLHYFGFQEGLGFNFSFRGQQNKSIQMISIGYHSRGKLTEIGIKYHQSNCIEEGNFSNKETISYRLSQRPRQKCELIYQNIHKKSLSFVNQYWEFKSETISAIDDFLQNQVGKKQKDLCPSKKEETRTRQISTERQEFYKKAREDYLKVAGDIKNRLKSKSNSQKRLKSQSIGKSPTVIKHPKLHRELYQKQEPRKEQNEEQGSLSNLVEHLKEFKGKKQTQCEKCLEREQRRRSNSRSNPKIVIKVSSSKSKERTQPKEIKYLKTFTAPERKTLNEKQKKRKTDLSMTPSKSEISRDRSHGRLDGSQKHKQQLQFENELKIREELYQEEQERQIMKELKLHKNVQQLSQNREFLDRQQEKLKMHLLSTSPLDYPWSVSLQASSPVVRIPQYQNLEDRRAQLIKDFRKMNDDLSAGNLAPRSHWNHLQPEQIVNRTNNRYQNSMKTQFLSSRRKIEEIDKQNRTKIEEFNKRYRNLLSQEQKPVSRIPNDIRAAGEVEAGLHDPSITSFDYTELPRDVQKRSGKKQRYEYYF